MKNSDAEKRKAITLERLGEIDDDFILEAAPTGRQAKRSSRGLFAALGAVAVAALVMIFAFESKSAPSKKHLAAEEEREHAATTLLPAPDETETEGSNTVELVSTGKAETEREWAELTLEFDDSNGDKYINYQNNPDWLPSAPTELLLGENIAVFRGKVTRIENFKPVLTLDDGSRMDTDTISIVTCLVESCYKGNLVPGEQTRIFGPNGIYSNEVVTPAIGQHGSGIALYTQLRPNAEIIAIVGECEEGYEEPIYLGKMEEVEPGTYAETNELICSTLPFDGFADCRLIPSEGTLFIEHDNNFAYDIDVYTDAMLGENPSMESAESYIKYVLEQNAAIWERISQGGIIPDVTPMPYGNMPYYRDWPTVTAPYLDDGLDNEKRYIPASAAIVDENSSESILSDLGEIDKLSVYNVTGSRYEIVDGSVIFSGNRKTPVPVWEIAGSDPIIEKLTDSIKGWKPEENIAESPKGSMKMLFCFDDKLFIEYYVSNRCGYGYYGTVHSASLNGTYLLPERFLELADSITAQAIKHFTIAEPYAFLRSYRMNGQN